MFQYRARLLAEMDLFVRACPLQRGRSKRIGGVHQPLGNQAQMLRAMDRYAGLMVSEPCIVEVECGYQSWNSKSRASKIDVDNVLKAVLDNLVRVFILADDRFVVGASIVKLPTKENYTSIKIYESELCYNLGLIKQKLLDQP